nr:MAG TPA: hypothetical protein [Caudoviricetes sp.]
MIFNSSSTYSINIFLCEQKKSELNTSSGLYFPLYKLLYKPSLPLKLFNPLSVETYSINYRNL